MDMTLFEMADTPEVTDAPGLAGGKLVGATGWFSAFGTSAGTIQKIMTTVFAILIAVILILAIFMAVKAGAKLMQAETPETRAEAKKKIMWIVVGATIAILATLIPTILWNTVGAYSEANLVNTKI